MMAAGRPRKPINTKLLQQLAEIQCGYEEMAAVLGCDRSTLERNYAAIVDKGRECGKRSLRRKQWQVAKSGNVAMLIWLGKQWLEQREKQDIGLSNGADGEGLRVRVTYENRPVQS